MKKPAFRKNLGKPAARYSHREPLHRGRLRQEQPWRKATSPRYNTTQATTANRTYIHASQPDTAAGFHCAIGHLSGGVSACSIGEATTAMIGRRKSCRDRNFCRKYTTAASRATTTLTLPTVINKKLSGLIGKLREKSIPPPLRTRKIPKNIPTNILFIFFHPQKFFQVQIFANRATRIRNCLFYTKKTPKSMGVKHIPFKGLSKLFLFVTQVRLYF